MNTIKGVQDHVAQGESSLALGQYGRALANLTLAIRLAPEAAASYETRARAYYELGDYDRALADAQRAVELDAETGLHYRTRGRIFAALGLTSAAREDFQRAARLGDTQAQKELWTM